MDPDEALRQCREATRALSPNSITEEGWRDHMTILIEAFDALDAWLVRGGFPPRDWQKP